MPSLDSRCHACGARSDPRAKFCGQCGSRRLDAAEPSPLAPEISIWSGGYAGHAAYREIVAGLVVALGLAGFQVYHPEDLSLPWLMVALAAIALILVGLIVYRMLDVRYALTDQRLVHRRGFMYWRTDRVELIDIDDMRFEQSLIEHFLGLGTIVIVSSDRSHPRLIMQGIAQAASVYDAIEEARRAERLRRGLFVESI